MTNHFLPPILNIFLLGGGQFFGNHFKFVCGFHALLLLLQRFLAFSGVVVRDFNLNIKLTDLSGINRNMRSHALFSPVAGDE